MDVPAVVVAMFPPSATLLLDRVRKDFDDAMLREIARADYGYMAEEMMAALRPIRDTGQLPASISGQLDEVLTLTRWCDPEKPNPPPFEPGPTGRSGHQIRLFACAVLLRMAAEPAIEWCDTASDATIALCVSSAKVLGAEMSEAVGCFLTWRLLRMGGDIDPVFVALALLILATRLRSGRVSDSELGTLAEWVLAVDFLHQQPFAPNPNDPMPLAFGVQQGFWHSLVGELRDEAATIVSEDVRFHLELCALLVDMGWDI